MQKPDDPADERERVAALQALDVLDTPPEERFDRYTRLAKRLFDVPIALVSLVDANRQWFKSAQGLAARETPRDVSFCGHTILGSDVFVVEDATRDERFDDNPLVTGEPRVRFYAGFPLPGPGGHRLGTLCIIDHEPRQFDQDDLGALRDIGAMVAGELSSLRLATTDSLTGLSNRRGFRLLARQAVAFCRRNQQPVTLVLIDMDGFKAINDTLGHDVGDDALREFSQLMLDTFRDSDVVARMGGDEFGALLSGADAEQAERAVTRLREAVGARNAIPGRAYELAFSAGVAPCALEVENCVDRGMRRADERMYARKRERRASRGAFPDTA